MPATRCKAAQNIQVLPSRLPRSGMAFSPKFPGSSSLLIRLAKSQRLRGWGICHQPGEWRNTGLGPRGLQEPLAEPEYIQPRRRRAVAALGTSVRRRVPRSEHTDDGDVPPRLPVSDVRRHEDAKSEDENKLDGAARHGGILKHTRQDRTREGIWARALRGLEGLSMLQDYRG